MDFVKSRTVRKSVIADVLDVCKICFHKRGATVERFSFDGIVRLGEVNGVKSRIVCKTALSYMNVSAIGHIHYAEEFAVLEHAEVERNVCAERNRFHVRIEERTLTHYRVFADRYRCNSGVCECVFSDARHLVKVDRFLNRGARRKRSLAYRCARFGSKRDFCERIATGECEITD